MKRGVDYIGVGVGTAIFDKDRKLLITKRGKKAIRLVDNLEWKYIPRLLNENDIASLIPIYCDMRIGPKSILPLSERLQDLKEHTNADEYEDNVKNGNLLEAKLKEKVNIDVYSITDGEINLKFDLFLNTEIG